MSGSRSSQVVEEEVDGSDADEDDRGLSASSAPDRGTAPANGRIRRRPVRGRQGLRLHSVRRAAAGASWDERCAVLFEDLRKPARVMVARAFGSAFSPETVEDVYANAWTSTLAALRGREQEMDDEELRSYLLTAVANHASKEMRRRKRKPTGALEDAHAQVLADRHQLSPDERASGSETGSEARDVLASLPPRRRAVILLRYGWGLEPKEVCRLIDGLSPRAYRKEITRGVEEMISRFRKLESGEWCESREPLLRDYVAGVADSEQQRQAREHIAHCRHCNQLVGRLGSELHELGGGALAWTMLAGTIGAGHGGFGDRLASLLERSRELAAQGIERAAPQTADVAAAGGVRGAGAAGAGALAKLAGLGAAGKVAIACISAAAIGGACLAGGVIERPGGDHDQRAGAGSAPVRVDARGPSEMIATSVAAAGAESRAEETVQRLAQIERRQRAQAEARRRQRQQAQRRAAEAREAAAASAVPVDAATATAGSPPTSPAPTAPASEQEFGLPAAASGGSAAATPGPGDSGAGGGDVASEFGP